MNRPSALNKGDTISLIAPASPVTVEQLNASVKFLQDLGFIVKVGESCRSHHGYLSGDDKTRAYDINKSFYDKEIKGVFTIRGGYGCTRILDLIDYNIIKNNPKVFIGYSDITALHVVFNQVCNLITYHGPMPSSEFIKTTDSYTLKVYLDTIYHNEPKTYILNPNNIELQSLHPGCASGKLVGGNLSVLCSMLGTKYEIDTKDKILFIEDIGEEPYKVDRMLTQLRQCNKLNDTNGIIIGKFTNCNPNDKKRSLTLEEVLSENLLSLKIPIVYNLQCGHCLPTLTLPLGENIYIDSTNKSIMII